MKKKILIVNNNFDIGGVQKSLINLLNHIHDQYDVTLFVFSNSGTYKEMIPKSVKIIEASPLLNLLGISQKAARGKGWIKYFIRGSLALYARIINNYLPIRLLVGTQRKVSGFDMAISFLHCSIGKLLYGGCNEFVLYRVEAKQKVAFIHCDFLHYGGNTKYNRNMYRHFDKIAAVSEGCRANFIKAVPDMSGKTFCVPNFHQYSEYIAAADADPVIYSHASNAVNIISVSRLSPEKGIIRGLEVIGVLINEGYNIKWHIIGDGEQKKLIEEKIKNDGLSGKVCLYGNQENPYRYIKNADVLFLPSYHEAAPMVINESKCLGVPVITSEIVSSKEMVVQDVEGFICKNDTESIYQTLKDALDHPEKLMICKRILAESHYNNEEAISKFSGLLDQAN